MLFQTLYNVSLYYIYLDVEVFAHRHTGAVNECVDGRHPSGRGSFPLECGK